MQTNGCYDFPEMGSSDVVYWGVIASYSPWINSKGRTFGEEYDRIPSLGPNNSRTEIQTIDCHPQNAKAEQKSEPHNRFDFEHAPLIGSQTA